MAHAMVNQTKVVNLRAKVQTATKAKLETVAVNQQAEAESQAVTETAQPKQTTDLIAHQQDENLSVVNLY